jgi:hypothetical protein
MLPPCFAPHYNEGGRPDNKESAADVRMNPPIGESEGRYFVIAAEDPCALRQEAAQDVT